MALRFADISSHNTITSWPAFLGSLDGLAVKVTQGTTYAWSGAPNALAQARNAGKLVAAYHFAGNLVGSDTIPADPIAEANWFLAHYTHQPGEVIILDWEPTKAPADPDAWAYAFAQRIIAATGVVQWTYLNHFYASVQSSWARTRSLGCALWAAWYGANNGQPQPGMPSFAPWGSPTAWQYTSAGSAPGHAGALDLNYFYGTPDQWRAFGMPQEADLTPEEHGWLQQLVTVFGEAYVGPGDDAGTDLKKLAQDLAPIERYQYGPDGKPVVDPSTGQPIILKTSIRQELGNLTDTVKAQSNPQQLIDDIVTAIKALPAPAAQEVIAGVLAGLNGAQLNVTQPAPPA